MKQVESPPAFSASAMVCSFSARQLGVSLGRTLKQGGISLRIPGLSSPSFQLTVLVNLNLPGYRPVKMLALVGEQTGEAAYALVNLIPSFAMRVRFGVS